MSLCARGTCEAAEQRLLLLPSGLLRVTLTAKITDREPCPHSHLHTQIDKAETACQLLQPPLLPTWAKTEPHVKVKGLATPTQSPADKGYVRHYPSSVRSSQVFVCRLLVRHCRLLVSALWICCQVLSLSCSLSLLHNHTQTHTHQHVWPVPMPGD